MDNETLRLKVLELADKYPNAIYTKPYGRTFGPCSNSQGKVLNGPETEGCIFGQALRELGVEIKPDQDDFSISQLGYGYYKDNSPANLFREAQHMQDIGKTWSVAVECLR